MEKHGTAGQATVDNTIRCIRFACYITKARHIHSEYVTPIAFPLQQWLHGRAFALRACLVSTQNSHYVPIHKSSPCLSNGITAGSLWGKKYKTKTPTSLNPKFICVDRISKKGFVGEPSQSFQLAVLQVGECVGVEYLQMYSHIKYSLLAYTNDAVDYRPTSCSRVHDKKLEKCARQQLCHVRPHVATRESPNSFSCNLEVGKFHTSIVMLHFW